MQPDPDALRQHFNDLSDEALLEIERADLTELAQQYYDAEMAARDLGDEPPPEEPDEEREALVLLTTFISPTEADLATSLLRSAGIPANLESEYSIDWTGALRLMVPASMVEEAQEILESEITEEELAAQAEAAEAGDPEEESNGD